MNKLENIVAHKRKEVAERKSLYPPKLLEQSIYYATKTVSLKHYLKRQDKSGIIAEIKRKSPSRGDINSFVSVERTSIGYMQAGASALSVLTDHEFFGGSNEDLVVARKYNFCPILRKEFIIDEYQLIESKSIGADAILLIAAILSPQEVKKLSELAHQLQLEVLLEVHDRMELEKNSDSHVDIIGVNNRNLKTFGVDIQTSIVLLEHIPSGSIKISESGIDSPATAARLRAAGFDGFLIGEKFMHASRPEIAAREFIRELNVLENKSKTHAIS